jgi:hypothetical protein
VPRRRELQNLEAVRTLREFDRRCRAAGRPRPSGSVRNAIRTVLAVLRKLDQVERDYGTVRIPISPPAAIKQSETKRRNGVH